MRVDPSDGREYTREQFIEEYGEGDGAHNWEEARQYMAEAATQRRSRFDEKPDDNSRVAKRLKCSMTYKPQLDRAWRFAKFDRVRCNVGGEYGWVCGQVQAVNFVDEGCLLPYLVMLEPPLKRMIAVPYDAPSHVRPEVCFADGPAGGEPARAINQTLTSQRVGKISLRFDVGARVACLTAGPDGSGWPRRWSAGIVRQLWYRPHGVHAVGAHPYAVVLDETDSCAQKVVVCHRDDHLCVRALELQPAEECVDQTVLQRFTERRDEQAGCDVRIDQETFGVRTIRSVDHDVTPLLPPCAPPPEVPRPPGLVWDAAQFLGKAAEFSCPIA
eukprot:COSAG02_NODE_219_length_28538_cov_79.322058_23_plen_329_part_00